MIREHIREIRSCYERELQRSPDLYGKLVLEWDIEDEGRVSRVSVKSNALGKRFGRQLHFESLKDMEVSGSAQRPNWSRGVSVRVLVSIGCGHT